MRNFASRIRCRCGVERKDKAEVRAARARDQEAKAKAGNHSPPRGGTGRSARKTVPPPKPPWKAGSGKGNYAGAVAKNEKALSDEIKSLKKQLEEARCENAKPDPELDTAMAVEEPHAGEALEQRIKDLEEGIAVFTKLGKPAAAEELKVELEEAKRTKDAERPLGAKIRAARRKVQTVTRRAEKTNEELEGLRKNAEEIQAAIAEKESESKIAEQELADAQKTLSTLTLQEVLPATPLDSDPFARERAFAESEGAGEEVKLKLAQMDQLRDEIRKAEEAAEAKRLAEIAEQPPPNRNVQGSVASAASTSLGGRPPEADGLGPHVGGAVRAGGAGKGGTTHRSHPYSG